MSPTATPQHDPPISPPSPLRDVRHRLVTGPTIDLAVVRVLLQVPLATLTTMLELMVQPATLEQADASVRRLVAFGIVEWSRGHWWQAARIQLSPRGKDLLLGPVGAVDDRFGGFKRK